MKRAAGIFALRPTGLKIDYFENVRSADLGPSNAEPSFCQCGVKNVVPAEEHKDCCETETRLFAVKPSESHSGRDRRARRSSVEKAGRVDQSAPHPVPGAGRAPG